MENEKKVDTTEKGIVEEARELSQVLREQLQELKELRAAELLSGRTMAGQVVEQKKPEIDPVEYSKLALSGMLPKEE